MANNKNNIDELVTDDADSTVELESLALGPGSSPPDEDDLSESGADTYDYLNRDVGRSSSISELKSMKYFLSIFLTKRFERRLLQFT